MIIYFEKSPVFFVDILRSVKWCRRRWPEVSHIIPNNSVSCQQRLAYFEPSYRPTYSSNYWWFSGKILNLRYIWVDALWVDLRVQNVGPHAHAYCSTSSPIPSASFIIVIYLPRFTYIIYIYIYIYIYTHTHTYIHTHIQGDQKFSVHLTITIQPSGAQRLFNRLVYYISSWQHVSANWPSSDHLYKT